MQTELQCHQKMCMKMLNSSQIGDKTHTLYPITVINLQMQAKKLQEQLQIPHICLIGMERLYLRMDTHYKVGHLMDGILLLTVLEINLMDQQVIMQIWNR